MVFPLAEGHLAKEGPIADLTSTEGGVFEVVTRGDTKRFTDELAALGAQAEGVHNTLFVRPSDGDGADIIFQAARKAGVQVRGLKPTRRSLEDVFMEAVDEDGSPDAG